MSHSSLEQTLEKLQQSSPNAPFLALGQTVFWDEPLKASWRRILDREWPSAQMVAGIHDTDYFAKTTAHVADDQEFIALAHDDGATRGLWSAAGELSSLFGSEDVPTRKFYENLGVPFDKLAGHRPEARRQFFSDNTSAYGWRGVVQTVGTAQISHDILAKTFGPALLSLLDWGFSESLSCLDEQTVNRAKDITEQVRGWVTSFLESCSEQCTLSDLYQTLLPKFYELLLDFEPSNFSVTSTASLLKFNTTTAHLPRFRFVQFFLDPTSSEIVKAAYSKAVAGGGMYTLDHFGEDALPFDVVVPGIGRGTLHVSARNISVDFAPSPINIPTKNRVTTLHELALLLAEEFGDTVVLVGKAVSLIGMLSAEFILVFHETASGYTDRTAAMNNDLRNHGITLSLNPILRIQYNTWNALADVRGAGFRLPDHLEYAFKTNGKSITAADFAKSWQSVVSISKSKLSQLRQIRSLRSLLSYLASETGDNAAHWSHEAALIDECRSAIRRNYDQAAPIRSKIDELRFDIRLVKAQRTTIEQKSASDFKDRLLPAIANALSDDEQAAILVNEIEADRNIRFTGRIAELALQQRRLKKQLKEAISVKRIAERSAETLAAKLTIVEIEDEANMAKLRIAHSAFSTVHGLPHTNSRPTSWWLPMVDPTGAWFDAITDTLEVRLEDV